MAADPWGRAGVEKRAPRVKTYRMCKRKHGVGSTRSQCVPLEAGLHNIISRRVRLALSPLVGLIRYPKAEKWRFLLKHLDPSLLWSAEFENIQPLYVRSKLLYECSGHGYHWLLIRPNLAIVRTNVSKDPRFAPTKPSEANAFSHRLMSLTDRSEHAGIAVCSTDYLSVLSFEAHFTTHHQSCETNIACLLYPYSNV